LRCTGGSKLFEDLVATEDASSVALMRKAGAIVIATTNAPEFALNIEASNKVHGRTRNPYNTKRTPGGSSGLKIWNSHYENQLKSWINEFNSLLDEDTIMLMPSLPFTAPYHHEGFLLGNNVCYTGIFNILGLPSTSCPIGFNKKGMPIGIQIVGSKNNDPLTLACAVELEKGFGGWKALCENL
ncbi:unnamed protein product, partial [Larinioides sclopetarius]